MKQRCKSVVKKIISAAAREPESTEQGSTLIGTNSRTNVYVWDLCMGGMGP